GILDADYQRAGAKVIASAAEIYAEADLIVKVKEPQPNECAMLREGQTIFTYLHLAPDPEQAKALMASGVTAIAYETVTSPRGGPRHRCRAGAGCGRAQAPDGGPRQANETRLRHRRHLHRPGRLL